MSRRLVFLITAGLFLSGCCVGNGAYLQPTSSKLTSWDRLGLPPPNYKVKSAKTRKKSETIASDDASAEEAELAGLKPYSKQWWSVRDAIDRAYETELAKKLIICRRCMPSMTDDQTGSIASK